MGRSEENTGSLHPSLRRAACFPRDCTNW